MPTKQRKINDGIAEAIEKAGGQHQLAALIGVAQATIHHYLYETCPAERAAEIEKATGVSRAKIRPDLFELPEGSANG